MLILSNEDADELLSMSDSLVALEQAYREMMAEDALNARRSDMITPTSRPDAAYCLKLAGGVVPSAGVGALRLNSDILSFPAIEGKKRKVKIPAAPGNRWVGLVLLFSVATGEPLAIFPDGVVQRMRVGATSGLAAKYMARNDASVAAIIGSGWQAGAQAMAVAQTHRLSEIRCFSPNADNCRRFSQDIGNALGLTVRPCVNAQDAVCGADIVLCATNSLGPVIAKDWIEPGMHLGSIRDREIDAAALCMMDRIVIHHPENMGSDHVMVARNADYPEATKETALDPRLKRVAQAPHLASVIVGMTPGRESPEEISCFLNYHGLGVQFAALGGVLYAKAKAQGRGRALPDEWFTETVHP
jgi:ornithine cyclodeaminase/alanine dehydrogenase-like protein (mu-crystallin family)